MSVGRYSFINSKLRAMKADILTIEQWDALLGARDMLAALRVLDATIYETLIKDFDATTSPLEVERALRQDFSRVLFEITNDVPGSAKDVMTWISRKFQKEVVKTLLRLKATEADEATIQRLLIPLPPFTMEVSQSLLEANTLQSLISRFPDTFFQKILEETFPQYEETEDIFILEHALDSVVLEQFYNRAQQLRGLDQANTLPLIGIEIDLINIMITLRSQILGIPPHEAEQMLLKVEYRLSRDLCKSALNTRNLEESAKRLHESPYKTLIAQGWEAYEQYQSLQAIEHVFHHQIRQTSIDALLGYPFHFGIILGYLNLKWYETLNLKALMHGKAENLDVNIIRRALIL